MEKHHISKKAVIDTETGELKGFLTNEQLFEFEKSNNPVSFTNSEYNPKSKNELYKYIDENLGNFYFMLNKIKDVEYKFRFAYLCTFMNYKGYIELGSAQKEGSLAVKKDLHEILTNLSRAERFNTIKYLEENELIGYNKGYVVINNKYCIKGRTTRKQVKGAVRMFESGIKELYKNATPKEHKKLDLLIKLLPYIHFDMNIICENPKEENIDNITPYTLTQLAKLLEYTTTRRLKDNLFNLTIGEEQAIMIASLGDKKNIIIINPKLYYRGNNIERLKAITDLFRIGKNIK